MYQIKKKNLVGSRTPSIKKYNESEQIAIFSLLKQNVYNCPKQNETKRLLLVEVLLDSL